MSLRILSARYCDAPGCERWTGAVTVHPNPCEEEERQFCRGMGWTVGNDWDMCPDHAGTSPPTP